MNDRERIDAVLACAALDRRLGGILLLDLAPHRLVEVAGRLAGLLGEGRQVRVLGSAATEEDLWARLRPAPGGRSWVVDGLVAGYGRPAGVVAVPDLATMSTAAARAAVMLVGAEVAHLERTGQQVSWRPEDRWLAACRREDVGRVSPHVLDRFAIRVDAANLSTARFDALEALPLAGRALPDLSAGAAGRVVEVLAGHARGARRDLGLARLARGMAALAGADTVLAEHVDVAARVMGLLAAPEVVAAPVPGERVVRRAGQELAVPRALPAERAGDAAGRVRDEPERLAPVVVAAPDVPDAVGGPGSPYPEDEVGDGRAPSTLTLVWQRALPGTWGHGHVIGDRQAHEVRDIAVVPTLLKAATQQARRCGPGHVRSAHPLHLTASDLRSHRRAPQPRRLLALVLDHTSGRQGEWYDAIGPYLRWAYAARATVSVVEVGDADAADELCAAAFTARSLLDPRVAAAFERRPGRATPLAHGLSLVAETLQRETQQGNAAVTDALLIVVTDGRGNVPLAASRSRRRPERVGREGVEDALEVARKIGRLNRVRSLVLDPGPRTAAHLTADLADALRATLLPGAGRDG
ncbi:hypothetical protein [Nonomuraea endophytica]|uniref:Magnesium chelatase subunit D n=1 Tax=Nonomuraea endophytica TaxID=714136 RepID=A0A7W8ABB1_9ACTN|nr:hypothetical protein [Nonomuraea endophytica]MBB5083069.1 magnesium chelatase subunit D [Nonomuraea endophytica]